VRAAEELLGVTRKLKQLWILSEAREDGAERTTDIETRMAVNDVAKAISPKLRNEICHQTGEEDKMDGVQLTKQINSGDET
jgi:hypothetical protein